LKIRDGIVLAVTVFLITLGAVRAAHCSNFVDFASENAARATWSIRAECDEGVSLGSGVAINRNQVLTAYHVLDSCEHPVVTLIQGKNIVQAFVQRSDKEHDVALIWSTRSLGAFSRVNKYPVPIGAVVSFFGSGGTENFVIKRGTVYAVGQNVVRFAMWVAPGNSGGALYHNGRVVGLVLARKRPGRDREMMGIAVPIGTALKALRLK